MNDIEILYATTALAITVGVGVYYSLMNDYLKSRKNISGDYNKNSQYNNKV